MSFLDGFVHRQRQSVIVSRDDERLQWQLPKRWRPMIARHFSRTGTCNGAAIPAVAEGVDRYLVSPLYQQGNEGLPEKRG